MNDDNDFIPEDDIIPEPTIDDDFVADEPMETDSETTVKRGRGPPRVPRGSVQEKLKVLLFLERAK